MDRTIHYFQDRTDIWIARSIISRIGLIYGSYDPLFPGYEEFEKSVFQYFQDMRKLKNSDFQYFQDYIENDEDLNFQYFQENRTLKKNSFPMFSGL